MNVHINLHPTSWRKEKINPICFPVSAKYRRSNFYISSRCSDEQVQTLLPLQLSAKHRRSNFNISSRCRGATSADSALASSPDSAPDSAPASAPPLFVPPCLQDFQFYLQIPLRLLGYRLIINIIRSLNAKLFLKDF